jgi:ketosteroid isomerase-like protein
MSATNLELVQALFPEPTVDVLERFAGSAPPEDMDLDVIADDAEIVFVGLEPGLVDGTYAGPAGLVEGWRDWLAPWSRFEAVFEEFIELEDEVVTLVRLRGATKHDGVVIEQPGAAVWTIDKGKVVRLAFHLDRRSALESVGRADLLS